jgi:dolichol kinase
VLLVAPSSPKIILRKGYHLIAAALFLPAFFWDPALLSASLAIAFAALVAAEVARVMRAPLVGRAIQEFMQVRRRRGEGGFTLHWGGPTAKKPCNA